MTLALGTDFQSAGGQRLGAFTPLSGGVHPRLDGGDTADVSLATSRWQELGGDIGHVVRVEWPEGTIEEWRVQRVQQDGPSPVTSLALVPLWSDLSEGGPVLSVVGGEVVTHVTAELSLSTWCTQYILAHTAARRLNIVLGVLERDEVRDGSFDAATPLEMLQTLFGKVGLEPEFVRTSDLQWTLNGRLARGDSVAPFISRAGRNELSRALGLDRANLATVVLPLGDAHPESGDRATMAHVRYDIAGLPGSGWVQLVDPETDTSPITVDDQWVGAAVRLPDLTTRTILDTRVSDGAVQIANTAGLSVGDRLGLATVDGHPLVEVFDADSLSERGRRVVKLALNGMRGEANELRNGRFADGMTGWSNANPVTPAAWAEVLRSELGQSFTFAAKGSRAGGTAGSTPFTTDGLIAGTRLIRGDVITQIGSTHPVDTPAAPDGTGALTLHLGAGLPANYSDNDPIPLVRRESVSASIAETTPRLGGRIHLDVGDAAFAQRLTAFAKCDRFGNGAGQTLPDGSFQGGTTSVLGDVRLVGPSGELFDGNLIALYPHGDDPEVVVAQYAGYGGSVSPPVGSTTISNVVAIAAQRLRVFVASTVLSGAVLFDFRLLSGGNNIPAWLYHHGGGGILRIIGTIAATGTSGGLPYYDIDVVGLPSATDLTGLYGYAVDWSNPSAPTGALLQFFADNWSGAAALTWHRETRTLHLDGSHSIGATTVVCKSIAALARRDWAGGDTLVTVLGSFPVTGGAAWSSAGVASVPIAIPAGVTLTAGMPVWSNWHGTSAYNTAMVVATTVVGPASAVSVRGSDLFRAPWATSSTPLVACYVVPVGAYLEVAGNQLVVAATVTADGAGEAAPTLTAANANSIPDDAVLTVTRPMMLRPSDASDGSVIRLLTPQAAPNSSHPAPWSSLARIPVADGATRRVTAFVTFALSAGTYATAEQPFVAITNEFGVILASQRLTATSVQVASTPTVGRIIVPLDLTATSRLGIRVYGGATDQNLWVVVLDAMLVVTDRDDVPFTESSWANQLAQRGADVLALRRIPAADVTLGLAVLRRWCDAPATTAPVTLGQRVEIPDMGLVRRITEYERPFLDPDRITVSVGTLVTDLTRRVAAMEAA